jgi:rod shape-determining protein mreC
VPVSVRRNGLHALAFGTPSPALMELRFQSKEADIQIGDVLQTSGLDFLYPPGVPVGVVEDVTLPADEPFAQVTVRPLANLTDPRLVLVLQPDTSAIPAQDEAAPPTRHTPQAPTPDMSSPDTSAGMSHAPSHAADAAEQNDADPTASTPGAALP